MYNYDSIIFSGNPGAGKSVLMDMLMEQLEKDGWIKHSTGDLLRKRHAKEVEEKVTSDDFNSWWPKLTKQDLLDINIEARAILEEGKVLMDSRLGAAYKEGLRTLVVFLRADLDVRARRAMGSSRYEGWSIEKIKEGLLEREEKEKLDIL